MAINCWVKTVLILRRLVACQSALGPHPSVDAPLTLFFAQLGKGVKLLPGKRPETYRIKTVISATEAVLATDIGEPDPTHAECQGEWVNYEGIYIKRTVKQAAVKQVYWNAVLEAVDQHKMFDAVNNALSKGNCLGIFPEGGSHDQTNLLPLKVRNSA
jgi:hypothetical protein